MKERLVSYRSMTSSISSSLHPRTGIGPRSLRSPMRSIVKVMFLTLDDDARPNVEHKRFVHLIVSTNVF